MTSARFSLEDVLTSIRGQVEEEFARRRQDEDRRNAQYGQSVERWRTIVTERMPEELRSRPDADALVDKFLHVIKYESGGREDAVGDNGAAWGLMQSHHIRRGSGPEKQIDDAWRMVSNNPDQWTDWGEGVTYRGKKFGALGNVPYRPGSTRQGAESTEPASPVRQQPADVGGDTSAGEYQLTPEQQTRLDRLNSAAGSMREQAQGQPQEQPQETPSQRLESWTARNPYLPILAPLVRGALKQGGGKADMGIIVQGASRDLQQEARARTPDIDLQAPRGSLRQRAIESGAYENRTFPVAERLQRQAGDIGEAVGGVLPDVTLQKPVALKREEPSGEITQEPETLTVRPGKIGRFLAESAVPTTEAGFAIQALTLGTDIGAIGGVPASVAKGAAAARAGATTARRAVAEGLTPTVAGIRAVANPRSIAPERLRWHVTEAENAASINRTGFRPSPAHRQALPGVYVSEDIKDAEYLAKAKPGLVVLPVEVPEGNIASARFVDGVRERLGLALDDAGNEQLVSELRDLGFVGAEWRPGTQVFFGAKAPTSPAGRAVRQLASERGSVRVPGGEDLTPEPMWEPTGQPAQAAAVADEVVPPAPRKPGPTASVAVRETAQALEGMVLGETPTDTLLRQYGGGVRAIGLEAENDVRRGTQVLKDLGKKPGVRDADTEQLFKALHGEGDVPTNLQSVFDDVKDLVSRETADTLDFDPRFSLHPSYFPRFWRAPKETRVTGLKLGAKPAFKKARVAATFSELLADGWEPVSWNPYDMVALRRIAGAEYREQATMIGKLKELDLAVPVEGPLPEGWSIPKVGPAFQGKPFAMEAAEEGAQPRIGFTKPIAVPDNVAQTLESMFGEAVDWGAIGGHDIYKTLRTLSNGAKRAKLLGSVFQQADFAARSSFGAFAAVIDDLLAGKPLSAAMQAVKLPRTLGRMALSNVSEGRRALLRDQLLSTEPLVKGRPGLTLRAVTEEGLSTRDPSVFTRSLRETITEEVNGLQGLTAPAQNAIRSVNKAMEDGLFEGVYPQAQIAAIENFIAPSLARSHPEWSDSALAGAVAKEANKMFSSIPFEQSALRHANKNISALVRLAVFSTGEPEALIKQAFSTIAGPNKKLWAEYTAGALIFLGATANTVHYLTTGDPLPFERYAPVREGGPLGVTYGTDFLAPDIPLKGRSGGNLRLDLVMQMDTALRMLDPASFIKARENVLLRTVDTQVSGHDYFGRPVEGVKERIAQGVLDVAPIPAQNLSGIFREGYGERLGIKGVEDILPEGESRLGAAGQTVQISGLNLRSETTPQMLDRYAREADLTGSNGKKARKWDDLLPSQQEALKEGPLGTELDRRRATSAEQGLDKFAVYRESRDRRETNFTTALDAKTKAWEQGKADEPLPEAVRDLKNARYQSIQDLKDDHEALFKKLPDRKHQGTLDGYYEIENTKAGGGMDWDKTIPQREAYVAKLSTEERTWLEDFLGVQAEKKTQLEKELDAYNNRREQLGYFLPKADTAALDAKNPDVDVQTWRYYGGVADRDAHPEPVLQSREAVKAALALNLPNRDVKLEGLKRPINQTAKTVQAWGESEKYFKALDDAVAKYTEGDAQALAVKRKIDWARATDAQKKDLRSDAKAAINADFQKSYPDLDAWLAFWGKSTSVSEKAGAFLKQYLQKYGTDPSKDALMQKVTVR